MINDVDAKNRIDNYAGEEIGNETLLKTQRNACHEKSTSAIDPSTLKNDKGFVEFSVQGSFYLLKKSFVLNYDWLLRGVINGSILLDKFNDRMYYIDCDATSF